MDPITTEVSTSLESEGSSNNTLSTCSHKPSEQGVWSFFAKIRHAYYLLWEDFVKAYTNGHVVKWSLWWAFATCGYLQVISYVQLLWENAVKSQRDNDEDVKLYNGAVEAAYTLISKSSFYVALIFMFVFIEISPVFKVFKCVLKKVL